jgi:hypothetical protein
MGKRGPKRLAGKREANGQLSRVSAMERARRQLQADRDEWAVMSPVIAARHRLHGVPFLTARDQLAGSVIGRLVMARELAPAQGDAAIKYAEDVDNYRQAMGAQRQPAAIDLNRIAGATAAGPDHVAFVIRAKRRYLAMTRAVQEVANQHRGANLFAALDYFIIRDEFHAHMLGDLRLGLNALAHHYGMVAEVVRGQAA